MSTGSPGGRAERDGQTGQDNSTISFTTMAPNLSIITLDQDMEEARQDSRRSSLVHHANPTASVSRDEPQWQQDAYTLSEMDYVQKYYEKAILTWLPIERYQGLCTGQLLHIALLEAVARAQLRPTWKGMEFMDITTLIYPLDGITCSVTSNRARRNIQTTEAMVFLHPTPMHYNAILAVKQAIPTGATVHLQSGNKYHHPDSGSPPTRKRYRLWNIHPAISSNPTRLVWNSSWT